MICYSFEQANMNWHSVKLQTLRAWRLLIVKQKLRIKSFSAVLQKFLSRTQREGFSAIFEMSSLHTKINILISSLKIRYGINKVTIYSNGSLEMLRVIFGNHSIELEMQAVKHLKNDMLEGILLLHFQRLRMIRDKNKQAFDSLYKISYNKAMIKRISKIVSTSKLQYIFNKIMKSGANRIMSLSSDNNLDNDAKYIQTSFMSKEKPLFPSHVPISSMLTGFMKLQRISTKPYTEGFHRLLVNWRRANERIRSRAMQGNRILQSFQMNLIKEGFSNLTTSHSSGLVIHHDYLKERIINEIRPEYIEKLTQEFTVLLEGILSRRLRNDMNHFWARLRIPTEPFLQAKKAAEILERLFHKKRIAIKASTFKTLIATDIKPPRLINIDPEKLEYFIDILQQMIFEKQAVGLYSIKSFVIQYEVLNVEEVGGKGTSGNLLDMANLLLPEGLGSGGRS